jgi:hypothetical protein
MDFFTNPHYQAIRAFYGDRRKIQNRKDFERYHRDTHPRARELEQYFRNWLIVLGIRETRYQELARRIDDVYLPEQL